jgi:hypothetical protein
MGVDVGGGGVRVAVGMGVDVSVAGGMGAFVWQALTARIKVQSRMASLYRMKFVPTRKFLL